MRQKKPMVMLKKKLEKERKIRFIERGLNYTLKRLLIKRKSFFCGIT